MTSQDLRASMKRAIEAMNAVARVFEDLKAHLEQARSWRLVDSASVDACDRLKRRVLSYLEHQNEAEWWNARTSWTPWQFIEHARKETERRRS